MKCSNCGTLNTNGSKFCINCGKPLTNEDTNDKEKINNNKVESIQNDVNQEVLNNSQNIISNNLVQQNNGNEFVDVSDNNNEKKPRKSKKKLLLILSIIILAIIFVVLLVLIFNPSSKKIFTSQVDKLYSSITKTSKEYDSASLNFEIAPSITGTGSSELENIVNKFKISMSGGVNLKDKTLLYNIKLDYDNKNIMDIDAQYDKYLYMFFNNLYDNPVMDESSNFDDLFNNDNKLTDDALVVLESYINAFNKSLKNEYFSSGKESINYNGKTVNAKVTTLNLTSQNQKQLSEDIIKVLSNDEDFISSYAKITDVSEEDVKDMLTSSISGEATTDLNISIYTTGLKNDFIKVAVESDGTVIEFQNKDSDDNYLINVKSSDGINLGFKVKYSLAYNTNFELKDTTGAVSMDDAEEELSNSFNKVLESEGYKQLDEDFKTLTGMGINDFISYMIGFGSSTDTDYNIDYDYSSQYY